eukprot:Plantae.Rhodophyta-Rhodochaete_pulchella.ctg5114.p1 GENE.Plantae.Rhodophyta-Rhodochaete_pulchella.ctg5114~~Plantae.Rhodophyta-Rhodochaete_pulchella.ctg5114.p1  ORF type:complete len:143 (+),score=0.89 Plantae.Rhodophyta-Rhodochaete_pulchella.ctg5114:27-431(+)
MIPPPPCRQSIVTAYGWCYHAEGVLVVVPVHRRGRGATTKVPVWRVDLQSPASHQLLPVKMTKWVGHLAMGCTACPAREFEWQYVKEQGHLVVTKPVQWQTARGIHDFVHAKTEYGWIPNPFDPRCLFSGMPSK